MDFGFTDEQQEVAGLARRILEDKVTEDVLRAAEAGEARFDRGTWDALAAAGLLGIGLPVDAGGGGYGIVEQCVVLEQVGRTVAPVPVAASTVFGAGPIARFGTDEQRQRWVRPRPTARRSSPPRWPSPRNRFPEQPTTTATADGGSWRLDGVKTCVPAGTIADAFVVPATAADGTTATFVVERDAPGLTIEPQVRHHPRRRGPPHARRRDGRRRRSHRWTGGADLARARTPRSPSAPSSSGVLSKALEATAEYTKQRVQFDRPIATFQAVGQRMADSYIDVEGVRLTLYQALWRLEEGLPADTEVEVAKFWAAEAAHRVAHAAVHLHGGTGIDSDYPLHRYFLAAKGIEFALEARPISC